VQCTGWLPVNNNKNSVDYLVIALFFLNSLLVQLNYFFVRNGYGFNPVDKDVRTMVLSGAFLFTIYTTIKRKYTVIVHFYPILFVLFFSVMSVVWSDTFDFSLNRLLTFVLPVMYIVLTLSMFKDGKPLLDLNTIIVGFLWVYAFPVSIYLLFDQPFQSLYLGDTSYMFKHNQYGWSAVLFLVLGIDVLSNIRLSKAQKVALFVLLTTCVFLIFASNNRSTWLSFIVSLLVFLFRFSFKKSTKYNALLLVIFIAIPFLAYKNSAVFHGLERTIIQLQGGEQYSDRLRWQTHALNDFSSSFTDVFVGRGMFNYNGFENANSVHNSYLDILLGCGTPVFIVFIYQMVFLPSYHYIYVFSRRYITFSPLLIIPYFENNLTGGQFLFYPWFTMMLYYSRVNRIM
jgi:hypothetical protein